MKNILFIFALCVLFSCKKESPIPPEDRMYGPSTANNAIISGTMVLYGSSTIAGWPTTTNPFSPFKLIKLGYGGKTFSWLNSNAGVVKQYSPNVIVLYSGDNDILYGYSQWKIETDIMKTILRLNRENPQARIVWLYIKYGKATWYRKDAITYINRNITNWINGTRNLSGIGYPKPTNIKYQNIASRLLKDGYLNAYYYKDDMLHINSRGYIDIVNPLVKLSLQ